MTTKTNLAPFKLRTRKGWIWIELQATTQARKSMRQRVARLNTEIAMSRIGI